MAAKKMTEKEKKDWETLYQYVKKIVLGYDDNQSLSSNMVLRLKGLLNGKFMENKNIQNKSNYSYETVLNTFKFSMPEIQKALRNNTFNNENHKFNYIMKIVEGNLNTVYLRMKNMKKSQEKMESVDTNILSYEGAEYKPRGKINGKFEDLW